jgi:hypothetical protein
MIFLFALAAFPVNAQTTPAPSPSPAARATPSLEKEFFKNVLRDQKAIWTAPLHLQREDAKWLVPSSVGFMALVTTDRMTGDEMSESNGQKKASQIISYAGSVYGVGAVVASFYLVGRQKNDDRARETGILSAEAFVDSLIVVNALKGVSQRGRPQSGEDRSEFFDGGSSFPSGHSIQAWSVATVVANEYDDHRFVKVAAYGIASAVSIARFTGNKHYLSDVLVGSALGYGIGKYVYHTHHRKKSDSSDEDDGAGNQQRLAIAPQYSRSARQYGIALKWSF